MCLNYTPFTWSDEDVDSFVEIANADEPGSWSVGGVRDHQKDLDPTALFLREFVVCSGERIGVTTCSEDGEGVFDLWLRLRPEFRGAGYEAAIYARLTDTAVAHGAKRIVGYLGEGNPAAEKALLQLGFERVQRDVSLELDLDSFDPALFAEEVGAVDGRGIALRPLAEIQATGVDWVRDYHAFNEEVYRDVPVPGSHSSHTLEQTREWAAIANIAADCWIVALEGDRWVGLCTIYGNPAVDTTASSSFTGVLRSHRGRGIATAAKALALERARATGFRRVETINEESNEPIVRLNRRFGYREVSADLILCKEV